MCTVPPLLGSDNGICPGPSWQIPPGTFPRSSCSSFLHTLPEMAGKKHTLIRGGRHVRPCAAMRSRTNSVYFVEDLPLFVGNAQLFCRLDGASQLAGPNLQIRQVALLEESLQSLRKLEQKNFTLKKRHVG